MSTTTTNDPEDEAREILEAKRDLFERIADADLPISEDIERILELVDEDRTKHPSDGKTGGDAL